VIKADLSKTEFKGRVSQTQAQMACGDFAAALATAEEVVTGAPHTSKGWILKAQALVAQHRIDEALETLREALARHLDDRKVLTQARAVAFAHGRFAEATDYALRLLVLEPEDRKNHRILSQCWMATGEFEKLAEFLRGGGPLGGEQTFGKHAYYQDYLRVRKTAPALLSAWRYAVENDPDQLRRIDPPAQRATIIQYWSQGTPPEDVQLVSSAWHKLLEQGQIGEVKLFDRASAEAWIAENAAEFSTQFSKAFHFAMEADIFRIAYASKQPCIYVDIDAWPLENTAEILKFGLRQDRSMLYLRSYTPWLGNGFFISTPGCPFFRELAAQCLAIDLDDWPPDSDTILKTFGPIRYNGVLQDLMGRSRSAEASPVEGLYGCSQLTLDGAELYFTHEAAVASMKPPFALDYKATEASWKRKSSDPTN
jgi:tetratricopeptide (TPR) repeat protein